MNAPRIGHIGVIVDDLDQAIALFENLFDLKPARVHAMEDVGIKIAHMNAENIDIELIQYTREEGNLAREVMGAKSGINHISVEVRDVHAAVNGFDKQGVKVMEGFPRPGSHGTVAFFSPETTEGILLEVCEP